MELKTVKISSLKSHSKNPNKHPQNQLAELKNSLDQFDQIKNIVVWQNKVIAGNGLWQAAKSQNRETIEIQDVSDWPEEKAIKFMISDNRLADMAIMDDDLLSGLLLDFDEPLDIPGIDEDFLDSLDLGVSLDSGNGGDPDEVPEVVEPVVKSGELWLLGEHRLLCGDSAKKDDVERLMDGKKADMVFTDPPYGVNYTGKTKDALKIESDDLSPEDLRIKNKLWFDNVDFSVRDGAYILATVPAGQLHLIFAQDWLDRGWLRQIMVWNKNPMVLGHSEYHYKHEPILFGWKQGGDRLKNQDRTKTTVWDFDRPKANREHPTMKPLEMWCYGISNHSKKLDLLYEPFSGSGTTLIACEKTNRTCYGLEIDPHYCDVILQRWADYTGKDPVREDGVKFSELKKG
jgi:site-specific DNA-methyltransferase (adenine-specific)